MQIPRKVSDTLTYLASRHENYIFMIPNPTILFTIAFIFSQCSVVKIHTLMLPMHVFIFDFKISMLGYHVWYLLINIHKALSHISQVYQGWTPQCPQGEGHLTFMAISLLCMNLLYKTYYTLPRVPECYVTSDMTIGLYVLCCNSLWNKLTHYNSGFACYLSSHNKFLMKITIHTNTQTYVVHLGCRR